MKKTIAIFLFIIGAVFCFAETGYEGLDWGDKKSIIQFPEVTEYLEIENINIASFSTIALGRKAIKSYFFENEELKGVTYYFLPQDLKDLQERLNNKKRVHEIFIEFDIEELISHLTIKELPEYAKDEDGFTAFSFILAELIAWQKSTEIEQSGYKNHGTKTKKKNNLYIYDYNDDTRVYIINDEAGGLSFVTYLPHVKDY